MVMTMVKQMSARNQKQHDDLFGVMALVFVTRV